MLTRLFLAESGPWLRVLLPARSARDAAERATRGGVPLPADLTLAVSVVLGKGVDWGHRLDGWFEKPDGA